MTEIRAEAIWARALSDPLRVRIVRRMLHAPTATPRRLATAWGIDVVVLRRQFRRLREMGVIARSRRPRSDGRDAYRLCDVPTAEEAIWRLGAPVPSGYGDRFAARFSSIESIHANAIGRLHARREQLGIARPGLARRAGIRPDMLARIERGKTDPRLSVVLVLADELDYPLERLFGEGLGAQADACR